MTIKPSNKTRSFRLSDDAYEMLEALARMRGISRTAMLEIIIREKFDAKAEGVTTSKPLHP